jgi:hypothetical protein
MDLHVHLVDGDEASLRRRVARELRARDGWIASFFTYFYTSRPPVHEAVVMPPPEG